MNKHENGARFLTGNNENEMTRKKKINNSQNAKRSKSLNNRKMLFRNRDLQKTVLKV